MENLDYSAPKSKSVAGWISMAGWIFGGLSPIFMVLAVDLGRGYMWLFVAGALFPIFTIIIGAAKKSKGQIFFGIAGILFAVALFGYLGGFGVTQTTTVVPAPPSVLQQLQ